MRKVGSGKPQGNLWKFDTKYERSNIFLFLLLRITLIQDVRHLLSGMKLHNNIIISVTRGKNIDITLSLSNVIINTMDVSPESGQPPVSSFSNDWSSWHVSWVLVPSPPSPMSLHFTLTACYLPVTELKRPVAHPNVLLLRVGEAFEAVKPAS